MPTYKDINQLTQKSSVAGTEKLPVSDTEYITPNQISGISGTHLESDTFDLAFVDENGGYLVIFSDGHIKTRCFDSKSVLPTIHKLTGKRLSVMGDSISTFSGISPSGTGFASFYPNGDVQSRSDMWWQLVADKLEMSICKIQANSASCVTDGIVSNVCCASDARTSALSNNGLDPDYIICECGLNDFYNNASLGTWDGTTELTNTITTFREAYANMLRKIQTNYPLARIYCCIPAINWHSGYQSTTVPINSAGTPFQNYINAIKEIAQIFGCGVIPLNECGINMKNGQNYTVDTSTVAYFHPNAKGMTLYADVVIKSLITG